MRRATRSHHTVLHPFPQAGGIAPGFVMREEHEVPEWLGDYQLRHLIARGGMGEVWLASKHGKGKPCVVKVLRREYSRDPEYRRRFFREAKILELLNHGRIVPIIHFGEDKGWLYIVMAYVDGVDLGRFCRAVFEQGEVLPVEVVAYVAGDVLEGLRHAHERAPGGRPLNIIHRDVTPGNVIVSSEGEVFVTDFGVARQLGDISADVFGTLDYMAPEQWEGEPCAQSDLYGVGGLILFMLTGRAPRRVKTPSEMYANLRPIIGDLGRDDVPEPLERLLRLCLEPHLPKRLRSAREGIVLLEGCKGYGKRATVTGALYKRHVGPQRTGLTGLVRSAPRQWAEGVDEDQDPPLADTDAAVAGGTMQAEPDPAPPKIVVTGHERTEVLATPVRADQGSPGLPSVIVSGGTVRVDPTEPQPPLVDFVRPQPEATIVLVPQRSGDEPQFPAGAAPELSVARPEPKAASQPEPQPPELLWKPWWSETSDTDPEDSVTTRFVPSRHPRPRSLPPAHLAEPDAPRLFRRPHRPPAVDDSESSAPGNADAPPPKPPKGVSTSDAIPPEQAGDPSANSTGRVDALGQPGINALALGLLVAGVLAAMWASGPRGDSTAALARAEPRAATTTPAAIPSLPAARGAATGATP